MILFEHHGSELGPWMDQYVIEETGWDGLIQYICFSLSDLLHCVWQANGTPLQYSRLENPVDGGAWWAAVHGVTKSRTRLSDFTFTFHFLALEKEMAAHSSVLAWRIPGTGEPGGLTSHRVGHDWSDLVVGPSKALQMALFHSLFMAD